jgi:hypothetical protein
MAESQTAQQHKLLRHVVMFKFKQGTSDKDVATIVDAFKQLPKQIPTIKSFEWGVNNSPEKLNDSLTHCFFVTFGSEKDRDDYLVNPAHQAFVAVLRPHLDKPLVLDYWAQQ